MEMRALMSKASDAAVEVVRGVAAEHLAGPTPCPEFDVRTLVNHLVVWTGQRARSAGLKEPVGPLTEEHDFTATSGWAEAYAAGSAAAASTWSDPAAWQGETGLSGTGLISAEFVGRIVFGEWLLHGWDLAVATGQQVALDEDLVEALYTSVAAMGDQARQYKVFGPEVPVAESAPLLDRALGLAGRAPSWKP